MVQYTKQQQEFIDAVGSSKASLRLEAVAGSGKTTTLVAGAMRLPERYNVLALAYNKKNADELALRLPRNITCKTLNSLGHRAVMSVSKGRVKLDAYKVGKLTSDYIKEGGLASSIWSPVKDLVQKAKIAGIIPTQQQSDKTKPLMEDTEDNWNMLVEQYGIWIADKQWKSIYKAARDVLMLSNKLSLESSVIDFDDQLYITCCWNIKLDKYYIVMVDEAQDLSAMQHELIRRTMQPNSRLIAVGDTRQAIYGFRGADARSLENLANEFNMETYNLTYSFRCGRKIIDRAKEYVPEIEASPQNPTGEVISLGEDWTTEDFTENSVVLCRYIAPLVKLGFKMIKEGVAVKILGRDVGKQFIAIMKNCKATSSTGLLDYAEGWAVTQTKRAKTDAAKAGIQDKLEAIEFIITSNDCNTTKDLIKSIEYVFNRTGLIELTTIHRAKGLEWGTVYWLDWHKVPAKFVLKQAEESPDTYGWALEQEYNLCYIATTRAINKLIYLKTKEEKKDAE